MVYIVSLDNYKQLDTVAQWSNQPCSIVLKLSLAKCISSIFYKVLDLQHY